jgi:hypothetical protein
MEDNAIDLTLAGADPEGVELTFVLTSSPSYGLLSGTAPHLRYTPQADFNGSDGFTFKVTDGQLESAPATVILTIDPVNDAPGADTQSITTSEDTAINPILSGSDVEGSPLTFTIIAGPIHGTLSGISPNLTYIPKANYSGSDSFSFKVNDGSLDSQPATIAILISDVNDAPVVTAGENLLVTWPASASLRGNIKDDGLPGGSGLELSWSKVSGPGTVTFAEGFAAETAVSFSLPGVYVLRLSGNDGQTASNDEVRVTVNEAPSVQAGPNQTITFPAAVTLTGTAQDDSLPDGELVLTWTLVAGPGTVTFASTAALITAASFSSPHRISAFIDQATALANSQCTPCTACKKNCPDIDAGDYACPQDHRDEAAAVQVSVSRRYAAVE